MYNYCANVDHGLCMYKQEKFLTLQKNNQGLNIFVHQNCKRQICTFQIKFRTHQIYILQKCKSQIARSAS